MKLYILLLIVLLCISPVFGNDGFYQGSGSSLIPIQNKSLRVLTEYLDISPVDEDECYALLLDGKQINGEFRYDGIFDFPNTYAQIGTKVKCDDPVFSRFRARWRATAEYTIEALEDQTDITMGFPIPLWFFYFRDNGGLMTVPVPSVVNFKTYVNDIQIKNPELNWVSENELAYIWKTSFRKGKRYELKTEYDFGVFYSSGFYKNSEYLEGETPWFVQKFHDNNPEEYPPEATILEYFLTPLRSWASPPPSRISIKMNMPLDMHISYAVPIFPKPDCLETTTMYFKIEHAFPEEDLRVAFPDLSDWKDEDLGYISNLKEFNLWKKTLGNKQIKFTCSLVEKLKQEVPSPEIQKELTKLVCVESCE